MVNIEAFRQMALSFEEAVEQPHFEKLSFRVKKKIFATLDLEKKQAVLKFTEADQSVFCLEDDTVIYPVKGAWGKKGWTVVELESVKRDILLEAMTTAYCNVAPKKLSEKYKPEE